MLIVFSKRQKRVRLNDHLWNSRFIFIMSKAKNLWDRSICPNGLPNAEWCSATVSPAPGIPVLSERRVMSWLLKTFWL